MPALHEIAAKNPAGHLDVTVSQVHESLGTVRLVDVREPHEFTGDLGHIDGSELVPLSHVLDAAATWPAEVPIVLVCRSGNRSGKAAQALKQRGFAAPMNMLGGMLAWNAARLPVAR